MTIHSPLTGYFGIGEALAVMIVVRDWRWRPRGSFNMSLGCNLQCAIGPNPGEFIDTSYSVCIFVCTHMLSVFACAWHGSSVRPIICTVFL